MTFIENDILESLAKKASLSGMKIDSAAGKGTDGKTSKLVEHNAIKKQKMEAKRKDINMRIEKAL